ncbi:MAG TPA: class I SAM-dependent methyltransferase [Candidatus Acidoferrales bacterium]|nr:class I SAM-dependent methyltransferase [Candidatus Acidoferrales bacterium]
MIAAEPALEQRIACRVCRSAEVEPFLDLGRTALANQFLRESELTLEEPRYPLRAGFCRSCGHVQLMESVPPHAMFDHYLYISSASDTLKTHLWDLSDEMARRYRLGAADLVIDIGCNDGTLLEGFKRHGVRTLGVDPARNLAALTAGKGIERFTALFTSSSARAIAARWGRAALITATNTFPHIQDLADFIAGLKAALAPGGAFVIETHYLLDLVEQVAFDTIYHEHVSYWALGPMKRLFERHGLRIVDAERIPLHHGQLRVHVQRDGEGEVRPSVDRMLAEERAAGLDRFETYLAFAARAQKIKRDLQRTLRELAHSGKRVAGYGAPAKGNTLLGFLEIGPELVPYIADRSPLKQGRYTPGTHIPVVSPEVLASRAPEYLLLLAWNFADEILAQQAEYRRRGGKFIVPVPEVRVIQ